MHSATELTSRRWTLLLVLATAATAAGAQQVYRIVGPDGRVTFSDKPPTDPAVRAAPAPVVPMTASPSVTGSGAGLPSQLRQVASRYPVTLYTGADCPPCVAGRTYLAARGIPFSERTVGTADDAAALQRLSGSAALPLLTIGAQQLKGYSETEWSQFLNAAGYPQTSQLPAGYRPPPATPLVAAQPVAPQAAASAAPPPAPAVDAAPPLPAAPPASNPAGITF